MLRPDHCFKVIIVCASIVVKPVHTYGTPMFGAESEAEAVLCGCPYLKVVWAHEDISDARAHHTANPLIKVLGPALGNRVRDLGLNQTSQALDLRAREPV